jgi:cAMP-dependent protein kinase regulator
LSEVPILASLQPQERAKIADVLESRTFVEGEDVIREGDAGEEFFLIESGTAAAIKGNDTILKQYTKGDYFGGKLASSCRLHRRMIADTV